MRLKLHLVINVLGILTLLLGAAMLVAFCVALIKGGPDAWEILASAAIALGAGAVTFAATRHSKRETLGHREGFAIVTFGWIVSCFFGALPLYLYAHRVEVSHEGSTVALCRLDIASRKEFAAHEFCDYVNAYFEATSGFTTTGATILTAGLWDTPNPTPTRGGKLLPHGLLFWRSMTHWLGGMGIVLLSVAILPLIGVGGMQLYRAEVPGPTTEKLAPRIAETAKLLWKVYLLLSAAQTALLMIGGMDWFNALCHTFATMATGGFSTLSNSIEGFANLYFEIVIMFFMFLAGVNFGLHFRALTGNITYARNAEFRFYGLLVVAVTSIIAVSLVLSKGADAGTAFREAAFQTVSIVTTTGFTTADFACWSSLAMFLLFIMMFVGGSAGSTGGGIKCMRAYLLLKQGFRELFQMVHPRAVRPVRMGGERIPEEVLRSINVFFIFYVVLYAGSVAVMCVLGLDLITAMSATAACIGNIGPGLGGVGPSGNYDFIPVAGKWVLIFCMIVGRLEIYSVLVLFTRAFWRR